MNRSAAFNRDGLKFGATFQLQTGESALYPSLLGQAFIIIVHIQSRQRILLPWVVIGMTGAVLILEKHLDVELVFGREILHYIMLTAV